MHFLFWSLQWLQWLHERWRRARMSICSANGTGAIDNNSGTITIGRIALNCPQKNFFVQISHFRSRNHSIVQFTYVRGETRALTIRIAVTESVSAQTVTMNFIAHVRMHQMQNCNRIHLTLNAPLWIFSTRRTMPNQWVQMRQPMLAIVSQVRSYFRLSRWKWWSRLS